MECALRFPRQIDEVCLWLTRPPPSGIALARAFYPPPTGAPQFSPPSNCLAQEPEHPATWFSVQDDSSSLFLCRLPSYINETQSSRSGLGYGDLKE